MTQPRTLTRLLLAILALYIAWQAQGRVRGAQNGDGLLLYLLAAAIFVAAFARVPLARIARGRWRADGALPSLSLPRLALLGLAFLSALLSMTLFITPNNAAWLLHLLSVALFLGAFWPRPNLRASSTQTVRAFLARALPLLVVIALASFARLWQIDEFPQGTWYDEAFNGEAAVQILRDSAYRPVFVDADTLPAHFDYLLALSFQLFGVSTTSMRFVTAAFGIVTAIFAYLLFRRWFGTQVGFVAGVMFAVMRYDLTFSRIALHGVTTPAFELAVLYFFDRALERRRWLDFALTGVLLGVGLAFYAPFRLFPLVLGLFALGALIVTLRRQNARTLLHAWLPASAIFVCGVLLAIAPVAQFAVDHRETFFERTNSVSLFSRRDEPDLLNALSSNTQKHLLMFNVLGDRNGRHNLPNEPMLDPLMGALGVLGFAYALWRWRDAPNALMLLVFFVMNLGGILSVDFEAPQSLRSIGVIPALVYFASLPLAAIAHEVRRNFAPRANAETDRGAAAQTSMMVAFGMLLALITAFNFETFFVRQKNSPEVWAAHSAAETVVAQEMNRLAPDYDLIVSSLYAGHPTLRFIAPQVTNYQQWTVNDRLPLARDPSRNVALLLDPLQQASYDAARRIYPNASYREFRAPGSGVTSVYEAQLRATDLRAVQGLIARYYRDDSFEGAPLREEAITQVNLDWSQTRPLSGTFALELRGTLAVAQYGAYRFRVEGAPNARLWLDEFPVGEEAVLLASGNHALRLQTTSAATRVQLLWQPTGGQFQAMPASALFRAPVTNNGLLGAYYATPDWSGAPAFTRVDPEIAFYFHNLPLPRPYTVEWRGKVYAPTAGNYRFATESIDNSQVMINAQNVVENNLPNKTVEGRIQLTQGWHDIIVRFADKTSHTYIRLSWTPPNGQRELVPAYYLSPPMGRYPTPEEIAALPKPLPLPEPSGANPAQPVIPSVPSAGPLDLRHVQTIGQIGSGPAQFNDPHGIAVSDSGRIFIADTGNRRLQVLDANGQFITASDGGDQKFVEPFAVVVTSSGEVIVLDSAEGWLYRFDQNGKLLGRMGGPSAQFFHPRGLSIDERDNLYVADTGGSRVVKLSLDGQRLQVFGSKGTGKGQFVEPSAAASDATGTVFATDVPNKRIEAFSADGRFLLEFPIPQAGPYNGPHIVIAPDQTLLVTAPEQHKVQRYARDGKLLGEWGGPGAQPGQFRLPTAVHLSGSQLWIVDTGNHRVQQWEIQR